MLKLLIEPFKRPVPDIKEMNKKQKLISAFFSLSSLIILIFIFSYLIWSVLTIYSEKNDIHMFLDNMKWMLFIVVMDYLCLLLGKGFINSFDK